MFVSKSEDSSKQVMERAPWRMFVAILKRKMWLEKKHQEVYPPNLKLCPFRNFTLWEIVVRKPDFAAVSRMHDMHRLALLIHACARSFSY